jgi:endogenous inhibitor of DNA gyrase (YacG/DUF329 family)
MFFFLIAGTKTVAKRLGSTEEAIHCPTCGTVARFERKSERPYLTLFFVLPVVPLGRGHIVVECPACRARFAPERARRDAA